MNMFRTLRADEIDCRIAQVKSTGLSLLLYKDARCDQNILDETVSPMNWKREHTRDNKNCIVSIWDDKKSQWISKEDTGTESNTEKEKGLASDSFKRACFNWGIGRELYTAPFIWIDQKDCNIQKDNFGKLRCYDNFTVAGIGYKDGVICGLKIRNQKKNRVVYNWGNCDEIKQEKPQMPDTEPDEPQTQQQTQQQTPTVNGQNQPNKASVTTSAKVPPQASKEPEKTQINSVGEYLANEITFMQEAFQIPDRKQMVSAFGEMRKILIDDRTVPNIKSEELTIEQAKTLVGEIYNRFLPQGESK